MPDSLGPFNQRQYRNALGAFATGVAVVTARGDKDWIGITINSFQSVSLDPPMVLWCIDKGSDRFNAFTQADRYTISILSSAQQDISNFFAKTDDPGVPELFVCETSPQSDPPAIRDALASFSCARSDVVDAGDHQVLLGRVLRFAAQEAGAALTYYRGRYGKHD
jgi:4-hydroxyphenylacetate 3-hydroxylase, reductase component